MRKRNDAEEIRALIEGHGLSEAFGQEVAERMELRVYDDGEFVCKMGERTDGLYVLVSGKLKIYTLLPTGKSMLLRFGKAPSLIGDVEWTGQFPVKNNVEAVGECTLLFAGREAIMELQANRPAFLWFMIENLSYKLHTFGNATAMNVLYPVENRFASYLLSLHELRDRQGAADEIRTATLTETAEMLGTSYRHLNRVITRFVGEGVLTRRRGRLVILDEEKLRSLAGGHSYA